MVRSMLDLIGQTPVIRVPVSKLGVHGKGTFFLKLEGFNPSGSIKARAAKRMIMAAWENGCVTANSTIVESSSGNLGVAIAMVGAAMSLKTYIVVDPRVISDNLMAMKAYGATVEMISEKDEMGTYQRTRYRRAVQLQSLLPDSYWCNQYDNMANVESHYETAYELDKQCGPLDYIVVAVSSAGHIMGIARWFKEHAPRTKIIAVEGFHSEIFGPSVGPQRIRGLSLSWRPTNVDISFIDQAYKVSDWAAVSMCQVLASQGILIGGSSGAAMAIAHLLATQDADQSIAVICADRGEKYIQLFKDEKFPEPIPTIKRVL